MTFYTLQVVQPEYTGEVSNFMRILCTKNHKNQMVFDGVIQENTRRMATANKTCVSGKNQLVL